MPEQNLDPVLVSAHLIVAAQQFVSRRANPKLPSVLSFGKVIAHGATNVIPNEVYLEGTFRTLDEAWRDEALALIRRLIRRPRRHHGRSIRAQNPPRLPVPRKRPRHSPPARGPLRKNTWALKTWWRSTSGSPPKTSRTTRRRRRRASAD